MERRASEHDTNIIPLTTEVLDWREFNSDFTSSDRSFSEVESTAEAYKYERIDLRPYMIESPPVCTTTDKI